jgi:hypothetical protein
MEYYCVICGEEILKEDNGLCLGCLEDAEAVAEYGLVSYSV